MLGQSLGVGIVDKDFMPGEAVIASIKQDLELYESERRKAARRARWRLPLFFGLLIVVVVFLALLFNVVADPVEQWLSPLHVFLYAVAFGSTFLVYRLGMKPAWDMQQSFRSHLLPIIFGFVSDVSYRHGAKPDSFDRLPRDATGDFDREEFDDVITGRYEGFPFELYEAHLTKKQGKSSATRFKGVVLAFEQIRPFPGLLVATRKAGEVSQFFRGFFGSDLSELESGVPAIDSLYEFRTDNVDAARPLVTGRLAQALRWLGETWPDEPARVALQGNDGFLLLPLEKNFFELPDISIPLYYKMHIETIVADMVALLATAALVRKVGVADETETKGMD
jgi:hypothetical protein